jgi:hypothetical protein
MPEWIIIFFIFYLLYLVMNTPKTSTEKAVAKTKVEKPKAAAVAEVKPKTEKPVKTAATEAKPKKPSPAAKIPKQAKAEAPVAKAAADIPVSERIGLTAGGIWRYLNQNGATPVAKLVKELAEDEKIVQRSIGWLAQEGKIMLSIKEKVETIELK